MSNLEYRFNRSNLVKVKLPYDIEFKSSENKLSNLDINLNDVSEGLYGSSISDDLNESMKVMNKYILTYSKSSGIGLIYLNDSEFIILTGVDLWAQRLPLCTLQIIASGSNGKITHYYFDKDKLEAINNVNKGIIFMDTSIIIALTVALILGTFSILCGRYSGILVILSSLLLIKLLYDEIKLLKSTKI